ncbi:MAG: hypothetical protein P4L84_19680 [Isosphaeraceae bacterium]|nr:hypothetical protein [Isosphaeraceae bacterium]
MASPTVLRRSRLLSELQKQSVFTAYMRPELRRDLEAEADDPDIPERDKIVRRDMLERVEQLLADPERGPDLVSEGPGVSARALGLFFSTDLVVVVPGFLGSALSDVRPGGFGLIWVNPNVLFRDRLGLLQLAAYASPEHDLDGSVEIEATGLLPILYDLLRADLEPRRYSVAVFPVDWRKDLDAAAQRLCARLQEMVAGSTKPIHLIAHSQGALVARRGLQLLDQAVGRQVVRDRVRSLVLLGPANYGSFSAAFALAGNHDLIRQLSPFVVAPTQGFQALLQSMSGIYQLLPWDSDRLPVLTEPGHQVGRVDFWKPTIDATRLNRLFGWGKQIDTSFFSDRTTVILGDNYSPGRATTVAGVAYVAGALQATHVSRGDGTVPDPCAFLDGAATLRARNTEHMKLPTYPRILRAVRDVLAGRPVAQDEGLTQVDRIDALAPVRTLDAPLSFAAVTSVGGPVPVPVPALAAPAAAPPPTTPARGPEEARNLVSRPPAARRLRAFAFDPMLSRRLDSSTLNLATLSIPWEEGLQPGPVGEYLEVIDVDPGSSLFYPPVDLNDPYLLAQDGRAPSEGDPRFHQQMVYAVAMTTIRTFELAIGRRVIWAPYITRDAQGRLHHQFVRRLRVYPHALREANAYYSPQKKALLFGYFRAPASPDGMIPPGGTIFACLSHDIVAHETTHALLDGMHRYFDEPSNPDVLAFHEALADIVALLQHFTLPEVLRDQIARTRGDLAGQESLLGQLAVEFGRARGMNGALRDAIGEYREREVDGEKEQVWHPRKPSEADYQRASEPHARGAVLVAAVFDAYLAIYKRRAVPLLRVATGGTGVLPAGDLHPELVRLLADQAARAAGHVLRMCIRALDYCPPVDITFGEYLRALVTADADLVPDDDLNYRVAVVTAFARRGIYPPDARNLSVETLLWQAPSDPYCLKGEQFEAIRHLSSLAPDPTDDRETLHSRMRDDAKVVHSLLLFDGLPNGFDRFLGVNLGRDAPATIPRGGDGRPLVEVHAVRPCFRSGPDGNTLADLLIEITQRRFGYLDPAVQKTADADATKAPPLPDFTFRGGCTLIIDLKAGQVRYAIAKDVMSDWRLEQQRQFVAQTVGDQALSLTFLPRTNGQVREPFAVLHRI